ncbi:ABC transporter permease [Streptomyces sp. NPDC087420]|uniref:ABC transporter permease n=1 Tax=Streptomyces sp. NPDC087420 TaxID=3365785 RepID=UPI0038339020
MTFLDEVKTAVTPRAALLIVGVLGLQLLFIASYVGALHSPKPTDVKVAVVAPGQLAGQLAAELGQLPGKPLSPRTLPDEGTARHQMLNRDIDAALIIDTRGTTDTLLVASGQGSTETSVVVSVFDQIEQRQRRGLRLDDVAPASPHDAHGLSSFYLVVGWCVGGYLCAGALAISAGARPANRGRATIRLLVTAVYAIVGGLLGAVITGPILSALPGSLFGLWGLGALTVFAVGAATLALQSVFGIVGIGAAILLIVVAGNPSAGGAVPIPLLPDFWRSIGPALPPGSATWVARSIAYFHGNAIAVRLIVLSAWAVGGTLLLLVMSSLRGKGGKGGRSGTAGDGRPPGGEPATTGPGTAHAPDGSDPGPSGA